MPINGIAFFAVLITLLGCPTFAEARIEAILGNTSFDKNPNLFQRPPTTEESEIILSREQFVISYNKFKRNPNWVAWKLEPSNLGPAKRSNNFKIDLELENYLSQNSSVHAVAQTDYKGSCFDRGHQTPSADRTDSKENNSATFVMSNMSPQTPFLNRVMWAHLEEYTRSVVTKENKKAYIISGPIYDEDFGKIGPDKDIAIPSKEFKLIAFYNPSDKAESLQEAQKVIAVIMPNVLESGGRPLSDRQELCRPLSADTSIKDDWKKYITNIEEIENLSGIIFSK